jgi:hypothetical protein
MSKIRLVSLLVLLLTTLSLAVFAKPPAPPPVDCSQYNHGLCIYHWDASSSCCKTNTGGCVWHCL